MNGRTTRDWRFEAGQMRAQQVTAHQLIQILAMKRHTRKVAQHLGRRGIKLRATHIACVKHRLHLIGPRIIALTRDDLLHTVWRDPRDLACDD